MLTGSLTRVIGEDVGLYAIEQGSLANANYQITFVSANFEITKADKNISFSSLSNVVYGDSDFNLSATSDSGLAAVSYTHLTLPTT